MQYELWQTLPRKQLKVGDTVRYHGFNVPITSWDGREVWLTHNGKTLRLGPSAIGCQFVELSKEDAPVTEDTGKRTTLRSDTKALEALIKQTGWSNAEACRALGVASGTISTWRKTGGMPQLAAVACQGMLQTYADKNRAGKPVHYLTTVSGNHILQHRRIDDLQSITLDGKQYWLLPAAS